MPNSSEQAEGDWYEVMHPFREPQNKKVRKSKIIKKKIVKRKEPILSLATKNPAKLRANVSALFKKIREADYDISSQKNFNLAKTLIIFCLTDQEYENAYTRMSSALELLDLCDGAGNSLLKIFLDSKYQDKFKLILSTLSTSLTLGNASSRKQAVLLLLRFGYEGFNISDCKDSLRILLSKPDLHPYLVQYAKTALQYANKT